MSAGLQFNYYVMPRSYIVWSLHHGTILSCVVIFRAFLHRDLLEIAV